MRYIKSLVLRRYFILFSLDLTPSFNPLNSGCLVWFPSYDIFYDRNDFIFCEFWCVAFVKFKYRLNDSVSSKQ